MMSSYRLSFELSLVDLPTDIIKGIINHTGNAAVCSSDRVPVIMLLFTCTSLYDIDEAVINSKNI